MILNRAKVIPSRILGDHLTMFREGVQDIVHVNNGRGYDGKKVVFTLKNIHLATSRQESNLRDL